MYIHTHSLGRDSPANTLHPTVRIRLEDVVEVVCRSPGRRLPGPPELVRLQGGSNETFRDGLTGHSGGGAGCGAERALEGLSGPAKAVTAMTGSMGLRPCRWMADKLSEASGDHRAPMTGWDVLSVALRRGM